MNDTELIKQTIRLARKGCGRVSPNPMVGAVIVKGNRVLSRGYHRIFGGPHAEVEALKAAREDVAGSSMYVNLEPCSHYGKQPPCVEAIIEAGIKRVVIGTADPNPIVDGKGMAYLQKHGVEVVAGVEEQACRELNQAYFKYIVTRLPFVTLKIAQTLDGRIAASDGEPHWFTSEASKRLVHKMRAEHDAVLAGIGTVLSDNPQLTVRLTKGVSPKRIVLDSRLRIPLSAHLLTDSHASKTIVATTAEAPQDKIEQVAATGAGVWIVDQDRLGRPDLRALLQRMGKEGIASVLVEGGAHINSAFLRERLVDGLAIFVAPKILGSGLVAVDNLGIESMDDSIELQDVRRRRVGGDLLVSAKLAP